jgi:hypothetical protein
MMVRYPSGAKPGYASTDSSVVSMRGGPTPVRTEERQASDEADQARI